MMLFSIMQQMKCILYITKVVIYVFPCGENFKGPMPVHRKVKVGLISKTSYQTKLDLLSN